MSKKKAKRRTRPKSILDIPQDFPETIDVDGWQKFLPEDDVIIPPPGKAKGCIYREDMPGNICDFYPGDWIVPRNEWSKWIGEVDLRPLVHDILNQRNVGSCAAEAACQGNMITRAMNGYEDIVFNPWFNYHWTSGGVDRGSSVGGNLKHIRENGSCPMSIWGREHGFRTRPSQRAIDAAKSFKISEFWEVSSTLEVGSALLRGFAVTFGWSGHSCVLTKLINESTAEYANSWDESWGDRGFGTIRLSSINFGYGAYAWRAVE